MPSACNNFKIAKYRYPTKVKWGSGYDPESDRCYVTAKNIADALQYYGCMGARITEAELEVRVGKAWVKADTELAKSDDAVRVERQQRKPRREYGDRPGGRILP